LRRALFFDSAGGALVGLQEHYDILGYSIQ
jgi:hypothetical protein